MSGVVQLQLEWVPQPYPPITPTNQQTAHNGLYLFVWTATRAAMFDARAGVWSAAQDLPAGATLECFTPPFHGGSAFYNKTDHYIWRLNWTNGTLSRSSVAANICPQVASYSDPFTFVGTVENVEVTESVFVPFTIGLATRLYYYNSMPDQVWTVYSNDAGITIFQGWDAAALYPNVESDGQFDLGDWLYSVPKLQRILFNEAGSIPYQYGYLLTDYLQQYGSTPQTGGNLTAAYGYPCGYMFSSYGGIPLSQPRLVDTNLIIDTADGTVFGDFQPNGVSDLLASTTAFESRVVWDTDSINYVSANTDNQFASVLRQTAILRGTGFPPPAVDFGLAIRAYAPADFISTTWTLHSMDNVPYILDNEDHFYSLDLAVYALPGRLSVSNWRMASGSTGKPWGLWPE